MLGNLQKIIDRFVTCQLGVNIAAILNPMPITDNIIAKVSEPLRAKSLPDMRL